MANPDDPPSAPFEGPEKLLEIWFAPSATELPQKAAQPSPDSSRTGLRKVARESWEQMLDTVKCKVLSVIEGSDMDAYLLSESSLFVSPHKLILKTCGTTLNLHGLPQILDISRNEAGFSTVHRLFYSRKSFMFPERQYGIHRDWKDEVQYLDNIFSNGSAYTVGKMNGDHWLLYMTTPGLDSADHSPKIPASISPPPPSFSSPGYPSDYTIEILMTNLSSDARTPFFRSPDASEQDPSKHAQSLSSSLQITDIFPSALTTLDAYSFDPCGYSANALIASPHVGHEGYYTIHVTPEEGWSYASFECNVPLPSVSTTQPQNIPDLQTLLGRVVDIFQPGKLSVTLFISSTENDQTRDEEGDSEIERAQRAFKAALTAKRSYQRTDKINYEFGGYDLAFASFESPSTS